MPEVQTVSQCIGGRVKLVTCKLYILIYYTRFNYWNMPQGLEFKLGTLNSSYGYCYSQSFDTLGKLTCVSTDPPWQWSIAYVPYF